MIIYGIDPGIANLGIAILKNNKKKNTILFLKTFKTSSKFPQTERLNQIFFFIKKLFIQFPPTIIGIEELFFNKNISSMKKVSEVIGIIKLLISFNNCSLINLTSQHVKKVILNIGNAKKKDLQLFIEKYFKIKTEKDSADALGIALTIIKEKKL